MIPGPIEFTTTRWSVVLRSGEGDSSRSTEALEELCRAYWYPLYAYVRRKGHSPEDACDLTQEFFTRLFEKQFPKGVSREGGRFRSFLLRALNNFLIDEWKRKQSAKRGGGLGSFSSEAEIEKHGETVYALQVSPVQTPERLYDRAWAETILKRVLEKLAEECAQRGDDRFTVLRPFLAAGDDPPALNESAARLNLSLAAFKSLLHRFRHRYRELLLAEVGQTVSTEQELQSEIRELMSALRAE
jgi:RNA polymerase sigma-70 factor (ECF subfamily)